MIRLVQLMLASSSLLCAVAGSRVRLRLGAQRLTVSLCFVDVVFVV